MVSSFIVTTTGIVSPVKFERLGSYHDHPTVSLDLTERFNIEEILNDTTIQDAIDNGEITVVDENGDTIVSLVYAAGNVNIFEIENYGMNSSYVGYGTPLACNILRVITTDSLTYTQTWASGEKNFNKVWANRANYTYL